MSGPVIVLLCLFDSGIGRVRSGHCSALFDWRRQLYARSVLFDFYGCDGDGLLDQVIVLFH
jgi:hypothetical protein